MSVQRKLGSALAAAVAVCILGLSGTQATAVPMAAEAAAERARVERAVRRLDDARARSAAVTARVEPTSAQLDRIVATQQRARDRLSSRARAMYRTGDIHFLSVLFDAATFDEFASRWELLTRMNRQDAEDLRELAAARAEGERAVASLLELQAEEARSVDELTREVARARRELASSEAALAAYEARIAAAAATDEPAARSRPRADPTQRLRGSGAWQTGVASHYGRNFTGRAANGETIGPYSMIVAHRTLPFGTLIEFEYGGKRAVARVADRGPHVAGRDFDLGPGVVRVLDFEGVHEVRYRIISL